MHLAVLEAARRGNNPDDMRHEKAKEIISRQQYTEEADGYLSVFDEHGHVGVVNIQNKCCLCVAHSHNLKCVCVIVCELLFTTANQDVSNEPDHEIALIDDGPSGSSNEDIIKKVDDIYSWINSQSFDQLLKKVEISNQVNTLHRTIFGSFGRCTNKRKMAPLHPNRKNISKVSRVSVDHTYYSVSSSNPSVSNLVNDDGSAKTTGRNRKRLREGFQ